ncbi:MAG: MFS transporter [Hyphomonadaceae bacterium]|nr:MFS transporter [Hyphomonadaceae bacterium]
MANTALEAAPAAVAPPGQITKSYRAYALGLLVAIYTVNFLDRQIVTILIPQIQAELNLSNTEVGAMAGLWFALLYTILGIPIARWADKGDRTWIMTASLAVWSSFTLVGGMAWNFVVLAISRCGVGIGEAGCTPTAHSLLAEYFPKSSRARAMSIYAMGISIGTLLGMALGGIIAANWGWRVAFFVAGAPGLLLAVVAAFTLIEPRRTLKGEALKAATAASPYLPISQVMKVLTNKPTFWLMALGAAFSASVSYSHSFFLGVYFYTTQPEGLANAAAVLGIGGRDPGIAFLGIGMGVAAGIGGVIGSWLGGWWCDHYGAKDLRQFAVPMLVAPFICLPVFWYLCSIDNMLLAMILLIIPNIGVAIWYGPVYGGVPGLVPPAMRATTSAILLFVVNMIGLGAGPTLFGMVSDAFSNWHLAQVSGGLDVDFCKSVARDAPQAAACGLGMKEGLTNTIYWSTAVHVLSIASFFLVMRYIRKDMES